ncbi:hypothetical protein J6590_020593 [Homalodisca vitripennis]|nr:hypothetical protein J6590_020593 [Homalodisca vitripennis]
MGEGSVPPWTSSLATFLQSGLQKVRQMYEIPRDVGSLTSVTRLLWLATSCSVLGSLSRVSGRRMSYRETLKA